MVRPGSSDILLGPLADQRPWMLAPGAVKQDLTPASTRRSDGDTRFQRLNTEGYRARTDWSGGHGMLLDADPLSYFTGIADTSVPGKVLCPQDGIAATPDGTKFPVLMAEHADALFVAMSTTLGAYSLYKYAAGGWSFLTALPAKPTCMASFRDKLFIGYDGANRVQSWDGAVLANEGPGVGFFANAMAGYVTQLHYLRVGPTGNVWTLARFDPDNADIKEVARLPISWSTGSTYVVRGMVAAFGSLWFTFPDSLWSYTSQTGNIGQAAGPLDRWSPVDYSGAALVPHDGALYYNAGFQLRRFVPGGGGKPVFPVLPRQADALSWGEPTDLRAIGGRLYVAWDEQVRAPGTPGRIPSGLPMGLHLSVWTGAGMHHIGKYDFTPFTAPPAWPRVQLGWDRGGAVLLGVACQSDGVTNNMVSMRVPVYSGDMAAEQAFYDVSTLRYRAAVWYSSIVDHGLRDVLKSLRLVRALALLGYTGDFSGTLRVEYQLDRTGAWTQLGSTLSGATEGGASPFLSTFSQVGYLKFKEIQFRYTLTAVATNTKTGVVYALMEQPSSIMPIANGFRVSVLVGPDVEDYAGQRLYGVAGDDVAERAAVEAARAFLEGLRTDTDAEPLYLTWMDGTVYRVRANTRTVQWQGASAAGVDYWMISFDLSEIQ